MYQEYQLSSKQPAAGLQSNPWVGEISGGTSLPAVPTPSPLPSGMTGSVILNPQSQQDVYRGSLKATLLRNIGNHIVASFLMGTQHVVTWDGILYDVGNDYLTIYQDTRDRYIVGDFYSLKFAEFYDRASTSTPPPPSPQEKTPSSR